MPVSSEMLGNESLGETEVQETNEDTESSEKETEKSSEPEVKEFELPAPSAKTKAAGKAKAAGQAGSSTDKAAGKAAAKAKSKPKDQPSDEHMHFIFTVMTPSDGKKTIPMTSKQQVGTLHPNISRLVGYQPFVIVPTGWLDELVRNSGRLSGSQLKLYVKVVEDRCITLYTTSARAIANLKQDLEEELDIDESDILLYYKDTLLEDWKTVSDYNIPHEALLRYASRGQGGAGTKKTIGKKFDKKMDDRLKIAKMRIEDELRKTQTEAVLVKSKTFLQRFWTSAQTNSRATFQTLLKEATVEKLTDFLEKVQSINNLDTRMKYGCHILMHPIAEPLQNLQRDTEQMLDNIESSYQPPTQMESKGVGFGDVESKVVG